MTFLQFGGDSKHPFFISFIPYFANPLCIMEPTFCLVHLEILLDIMLFISRASSKRRLFPISCVFIFWWIDAEGSAQLSVFKMSASDWLMSYCRFSAMFLKVQVKKLLLLLVVGWGNYLD